MNSIFAAWLLSGLVACTLDEPYIPANPGEDPTPPTVTEYQPIALTTGADGHFEVTGSSVKIGLNGKNSTFGVCLPQLARGHFIAEATADKTLNFGLAIVREKDGKPDFNNYTSVSVCAEAGVPTVRVLDRQEGVDNVLDNTKKISLSDLSFRYAIPLGKGDFSVPFTASTGKARVIRNDISGFFHFYVSVGKEINGAFRENWIELAQSKDWGAPGQRYFICPIARTGADGPAEVNYSDIRFEEFEAGDVPGASGFVVERRAFTWAGFPGSATVIGFDPKFCPAADGQRQFVFWSEANFVPAWRMSDELLYGYEFAETWSNLEKGCFEPMSDRLLAYAKVDIVEDNKVRKVVKYHYALINPDYKAPYPNGIYPEVDEYYTLYADGVGVRRIEYIQKQSGQSYFQYHELSEPMVIAGSSTIPSDHVRNPAFSVSNLSGNRYDLYPAKPFDEVNQHVKNWSEQIYVAHLNDAPDAFSVFSYTPERPEVSPLPIANDLTWHDVNYQMSHWPVDKQPYLNARHGDYDKSTATWPSQVSHSSLIGVEAKGDVAWNTAYQVNPNGDKYRVYLMLLGISQPGAEADIDAYTRSWLYLDSPTDLEGVTYDPNVTGYSKRELVLAMKADASGCRFACNPAGAIKNPVFRIDGWTGTGRVTLKVDGQLLAPDNDYLSDKIGESLVIWLNKATSSTFSVEITPEE
ncbi:MAG: hypothetical protein LBN29_13490 [Mediterranea sp.]|jgi:hypothetical protein|nr:hypothetical protein [Mediterranea sp.]